MFAAIIGNIGTTEIIILLVIALLLFGRRLPEVGRSLGKGIVEFKKGLKGVQDDLDEDLNDVDRKIDLISASKKEPVDIASKKQDEKSEGKTS
jgi:sec-independent protein translocase protein TatA